MKPNAFFFEKQTQHFRKPIQLLIRKPETYSVDIGSVFIQSGTMLDSINYFLAQAEKPGSNYK